MPNRREHQVIGAGTGAVYAAVHAQDEPGLNQLIEAFGGGVAGFYTARLPDIIDPPVSPRHRGVGHAAFPVGSALYWTDGQAKKFQVVLRQFAAEQSDKAQSSDEPFDKLVHSILWAMSTFAAGAAVGGVAGYASHVALDAFTPSGLPLIAKGT